MIEKNDSTPREGPPDVVGDAPPSWTAGRVSLRCNVAWAVWLGQAASHCDLTGSDFLAQAAARMAEQTGFYVRPLGGSETATGRDPTPRWPINSAPSTIRRTGVNRCQGSQKPRRLRRWSRSLPTRSSKPSTRSVQRGGGRYQVDPGLTTGRSTSCVRCPRFNPKRSKDCPALMKPTAVRAGFVGPVAQAVSTMSTWSGGWSERPDVRDAPLRRRIVPGADGPCTGRRPEVHQGAGRGRALGRRRRQREAVMTHASAINQGRRKWVRMKPCGAS